MYRHFTDNQLSTSIQSGFRPGDSTINQLLYITQKIYSAFEEFPLCKTGAVFLDISKAFDKVWHEGLVFKLKTFGISGPLLALIVYYLLNQQQCVVLNGKTSVWSYISAGVPQGSVLRPLFSVYINDLVDDISSDAKLFADDTSLFTVIYDEITSANQLSRDLKVISEWAHQWKPSSFFSRAPVVMKDEQKHLGIILDSALNFHSHVKEKIVSARRGIGVIHYLSKYVSCDVLDQMYKLYVRLHLDYGDIIYHKVDSEL